MASSRGAADSGSLQDGIESSKTEGLWKRGCDLGRHWSPEGFITTGAEGQETLSSNGSLAVKIIENGLGL